MDPDKTLIEIRTQAWPAPSEDEAPTLVQEVHGERLEPASTVPYKLHERRALREDVTVIHGHFDPRTPIVSDPANQNEQKPVLDSGKTQPPARARAAKARTALSLQWLLARVPQNVALATALGATLGLVCCGLLVGSSWLFAGKGGALRARTLPGLAEDSARLLANGTERELQASAAEAEIVAWVVTQSGRPVQGARVRIENEKQLTDSQGRAEIVSRLGPAQMQMTSVTVECPEGHAARESERSLKWVLASGPSAPLRREVTFYCEVNTVEVQVELRVRGGDVHFWLGERDLGVSENGALTRSLRVPSHSEQVLTVEPLPKKGQTRRPKILGGSASLRVEETPLAFTHTLELSWPKRSSSKSVRIPYRL